MNVRELQTAEVTVMTVRWETPVSKPDQTIISNSVARKTEWSIILSREGSKRTVEERGSIDDQLRGL